MSDQLLAHILDFVAPIKDWLAKANIPKVFLILYSFFEASGLCLV